MFIVNNITLSLNQEEVSVRLYTIINMMIDDYYYHLLLLLL